MYKIKIRREDFQVYSEACLKQWSTTIPLSPNIYSLLDTHNGILLFFAVSQNEWQSWGFLLHLDWFGGKLFFFLLLDHTSTCLLHSVVPYKSIKHFCSTKQLCVWRSLVFVKDILLHSISRFLKSVSHQSSFYLHITLPHTHLYLYAIYE